MNHALLIEDDSTTATLLMALLKSRGLTVDVAANGKHAIRALEAKDYEVVLIDLMLPELDGFQVIEYVKAARRDLLSRIVIISGAPDEVRQTLDPSGFRACLPKPLVVDHLLAVLP